MLIQKSAHFKWPGYTVWDCYLSTLHANIEDRALVGLIFFLTVPSEAAHLEALL